MAKIADENKENDVGVMDDIGQEIVQANKEALEKEIELFTNNLVQKEKLKVRFARQWKRDEEIWTIKLDNIRKIEPIYEYEKSDKYWELLTDAVMDQYLQDKFTTESKLKHFDMEKEDITAELESCQKKLDEMGE